MCNNRLLSVQFLNNYGEIDTLTVKKWIKLMARLEDPFVFFLYGCSIQFSFKGIVLGKRETPLMISCCHYYIGRCIVWSQKCSVASCKSLSKMYCSYWAQYETKRILFCSSAFFYIFRASLYNIRDFLSTSLLLFPRGYYSKHNVEVKLLLHWKNENIKVRENSRVTL